MEKNTYWYKHKKRMYKTHKIWIKNNKNKCKIYTKLNQIKNKIIVFQIYSNGTMKCNNCGFDNMDGLTIDHIKNNGAEHRKKLNMIHCGTAFYQWLIRNNFPSDYQVLCANCQLIKQINGGVL